MANEPCPLRQCDGTGRLNMVHYKGAVACACVLQRCQPARPPEQEQACPQCGYHWNGEVCTHCAHVKEPTPPAACDTTGHTPTANGVCSQCDRQLFPATPPAEGRSFTTEERDEYRKAVAPFYAPAEGAAVSGRAVKQRPERPTGLGNPYKPGEYKRD
jgi:hypothetical protein